MRGVSEEQAAERVLSNSRSLGGRTCGRVLVEEARQQEGEDRVDIGIRLPGSFTNPRAPKLGKEDHGANGHAENRVDLEQVNDRNEQDEVQEPTHDRGSEYVLKKRKGEGFTAPPARAHF